MTGQDDSGRVRLDRWLWAARFFKTRSLAAAAIEGGKVVVNDETVKRSKLVKVGDTVRVRKGPYELVLDIRGLSEQRGPAPRAQMLYEETEDSKEMRARLAEDLAMERALAPTPIIKGRPTKKDRRSLDRLRRDPSK